MAKGMYLGVSGKAQKVKKAYIGVDGKARKIKKMYIGDANGKARLCWSDGGTFIVAGYYGSLTSDDGINWNTHPGSMSGWSLYACGNGVAVIAKYSNGTVSMYYSRNGASWTASAVLANGFSNGCYGNVHLSFCNERFIVINDHNMYSSTDGITWTLVNTFTRCIGAYLMSNIGYGLYNGSYCYVAQFCNFFSDTDGGKLLYSTDLINWYNITNDAPTAEYGYKAHILSGNGTLYWLRSDQTTIKLNMLNTSSKGTTYLYSFGYAERTFSLDNVTYVPESQYIFLSDYYGQAWYYIFSSNSWTEYTNPLPIAYWKEKYFRQTVSYNNSAEQDNLWYATSFNDVKNGIWTLCYTGPKSTVGMNGNNGIMYIE